MKIVFITTSISRAGAEIMLYNLLSNIDCDRFEPKVIPLMDTGAIGEQIEKLSIPVQCVGMLKGKPTIASAKRIIEFVNKIHPDLIQRWMYHGNLAAQFFNSVAGQKTPLLWSIHYSLHKMISGEKPLTQAIIRVGSWTSQYITEQY